MGSAVVLALCTPRVRKNLPAEESCLIVPAAFCEPLDKNVELLRQVVVAYPLAGRLEQLTFDGEGSVFLFLVRDQPCSVIYVVRGGRVVRDCSSSVLVQPKVGLCG